MKVYMTRAFIIVSERSKELYSAVSSVAVVADVVIIDFIIARPCTDHSSLFTHSSWGLVSKYNAAEVKAKPISNLIPIRVVLECPLESLPALGGCQGRLPARLSALVPSLIHDIFKS
jgi:hypothetical protein